MVATSGDRLLPEETESAIAEVLLSRVALVTPNLQEAAVLSGGPVTSLAEMAAAARLLVDRGAGAALIKGGHLDGDAVDLFWDGETERIWRRSRIDTVHTHGTGCTLSAAITAGLATGNTLEGAVDRAIRFVSRAIQTAPGLGKGHGPVNHFAPTD